MSHVSPPKDEMLLSLSQSRGVSFQQWIQFEVVFKNLTEKQLIIILKTSLQCFCVLREREQMKNKTVSYVRGVLMKVAPCLVSDLAQ